MYMPISLIIILLVHVAAVAVSSINDGAPADDFQPPRIFLFDWILYNG